MTTMMRMTTIETGDDNVYYLTSLIRNNEVNDDGYNNNNGKTQLYLKQYKNHKTIIKYTQNKTNTKIRKLRVKYFKREPSSFLFGGAKLKECKF